MSVATPRTLRASRRKRGFESAAMIRRMNYNNFAARLQLPPPSRPPIRRLPGRSTRRSTSDRLNSSSIDLHRSAPKPLGKLLSTGVLALGIFLASLGSASAAAYIVAFDQPTIDKWQYPFGGAGGTRTNASTFGAVGSAGFDDRDAEFYNAFDTASIVPSGLGAASYAIVSATFTLSLGVGPNGDVPSVTYDGSYDPIASYGATGQPVNDDPGRSLELYGVGYRGGLSNTTVTETSPFGTTGEGTRNLYPTDFSGNTSLSGGNRDVGNNVTNDFDTNPFAVGQVDGDELTNGMIEQDADIVFSLDLTNPDVVRYLQLSLNEGRVSFLVTSLHAASQTGPVVYPVYYTKENLLGGLPGRLDMEVQTVPEPSSLFLALSAAVAVLATTRRRPTASYPDLNL